MRFENVNARTLSFSLAFLISACAANLACAQAAEPTIRTFGFWVHNAQEVPDFTSESSHSVITFPFNRGGEQQTLQQWIGGQLTDFPSDEHDFDSSSHWVSRPAHHATSQKEADHGIYFWLKTEEAPEPPPVGAHTLTGTDGLIIDAKVLYISECKGGDAPAHCYYGDASAGNHWLGTNPNRGNAFVVVTAIFSK